MGNPPRHETITGSHVSGNKRGAICSWHSRNFASYAKLEGGDEGKKMVA